MAGNVSALRSGTDVFDSRGEKIGTVGDVFSAEPPMHQSGDIAGTDAQATQGQEASETEDGQPSGGAVAMSLPYPGVDAGPQSVGAGSIVGGIAPIPAGAGADQPGVEVTPSDTKYFQVRSGGILGIGGHTWYVPFSVIDVATQEAVTLSCSKEQCAEGFSERPPALAEQIPAG
jgi:hypothetical protein